MSDRGTLQPTMDPAQIGRLSTLMTTELDRRYAAGTVARSSYDEQRQAITEHTDRLHTKRRATPEGDPRQLGLAVTQAQRDAARSSIGRAPVAADVPVRLTQQGEWQTSLDGAVETRTSLGTSARGSHYATETSFQGSGPGDLAWSRPFSSTGEAQRAASVVSDRILGNAPPVSVQAISQGQRDAARSQAVARPPDSAQMAQQRVQALRPQGHVL